MYTENIKALGWSDPLAFQNQTAYIRKLLLEGYVLNTRQARFAGIADFRTRIADLKRMGLPVTVQTKQAIDLFTGELNTHRVLHVWMTTEQRCTYREMLGL